MNEKNYPWIVACLLVILIGGMFYFLGSKQLVVSSESTPKISVSGSAEKEVMPDKAVLTLTVQTEGETANKVQADNAVIMDKVIKALKEAGIKDQDLETSGYYLYPWKDYNYQTGETKNKGYKLENTLTVTTYEIGEVGKLIDLAVANGVNNVRNAVFSLSDDKEKQTKSELVAQASQNARLKAKSLADNLDVSLDKPILITESSYTPGIWYARSEMLSATKAVDSAPPTPINPQQVTVSVSVNVDYSIK